LRTSIILAAVAAVYTVGKQIGPNALAKQEGYILDLTPHRFFVNNLAYLNDLFYTFWFTTSRRLVIAWLILTLICVLARKRELWWAWFVVSTVTLPTSFTITPRAGPGLYVPLFGWAILVSAIAVTFLKRRNLQWSAAVAGAVAFAWLTIPNWRGQRGAFLDSHQLTWSVISQIRELPSHPAPRSRILFLTNPFHEWDTYFIANLIWNDHTLSVDLSDKFTPAPDPAQYNWVLTLDAGGKLRVVRSQ
jgi:hypothetical protein